MTELSESERKLLQEIVLAKEARDGPVSHRLMMLETGLSTREFNRAKDALRRKGLISFPTGKFDRLFITVKGFKCYRGVN